MKKNGILIFTISYLLFVYIFSYKKRYYRFCNLKDSPPFTFSMVSVSKISTMYSKKETVCNFYCYIVYLFRNFSWIMKKKFTLDNTNTKS